MIINNENNIGMLSEEFNQLLQQIKEGDIKFHKFYNTEFSANEFAFMKYMTNYNDSKRSKILNKTYYDIETYVDENGNFTDPIEVDRPVNSIALYNNIKNEAYIICYITDCVLQDKDQIKKGVLKEYNDACKKKSEYIIEGMKINIFIEENEKELLSTFFSLMKSMNTLMLIGFNSSMFDDPYLLNRSSKLFGDDVRNDMVSDFGTVKKYSESAYEIPDYKLVDLLKLYKPVGQGGGGLGKSLPDYKLNTICKKELKLSKLDLDLGFREAYLQNIVLYLAYNLLDTLLTFKLDQKLQFLESNFDLAKYNNATVGATLTGRSFLYSYRNDLMYYKNNKLVRANKFSKEVLYEPKIIV